MKSTLTPAVDAGYRLGFDSLDAQTVIDELPLEGSLPAWLTGTLLRNGPARFAVGGETYHHWFDGLAMLHRFSIGGGRVAYANRFLKSPAFCEAERTGRIARSEFATDPQRGIIARVGAAFGSDVSANANVNIVPFADGYLALTETPEPVAFDGLTLETRGVRSYDDNVGGQIITAHPLHDPRRRATFNVVIEIARKSRYTVVRIEDGTLRRTPIAAVAIDEPAYLHAFGATGRYLVVAEYPLVVRPLDMVLRRKPFIENYVWRPERGTRFHVIDKDTGARAGTYESEAFFAFHHVNAYDDGDSIVVDICAYDDAAIVSDLRLQNLRAAGPPNVARPAFRRFRLVPGCGSANREDGAGISIELPRIAPRHAATDYRYAYGVDNTADGSALFDRLVKLDVQTQTFAAWSAPDAHFGEPVFVARPGGVDEDDGVLLSIVLDARSATSYLTILDARTLAECARARVPHHIPFGFHGLFD